MPASFADGNSLRICGPGRCRRHEPSRDSRELHCRGWDRHDARKRRCRAAFCRLRFLCRAKQESRINVSSTASRIENPTRGRIPQCRIALVMALVVAGCSISGGRGSSSRRLRTASKIVPGPQKAERQGRGAASADRRKFAEGRPGAETGRRTRSVRFRQSQRGTGAQGYTRHAGRRAHGRSGSGQGRRRAHHRAALRQ